MSVDRELIENLATKLVNIALQIHIQLGPGLFESVYEEAFCIELIEHGIKFKRQQQIDILYKEHKIEKAFIADIIADDLIIIEIKSVEELHPVHFKQLGTYLKLTGKRLGLLINFNESAIKVKRVANKL